MKTKLKQLKLKLRSLFLFLRVVNLYRYSIDYTQEVIRTFFLFLSKLLGSKFNFGVIFSQLYGFIKKNLIFGFVKYILTFVFILWILFEMIFLRFYLVTTPTDSQISVDRKELRQGYSRFLPVMLTESLMFFSRTNRRVFRILWLFFSNLRALCWLIEIVYLEDLRFFFGRIFFYFFRVFFFILVFVFFSFIHFFLRGFNVILDFLFFFFKLRLVRIFHFIGRILYCFFFLPLIMVKQTCRLLLLIFPKFFLFFSIFSVSNFLKFYAYMLDLKLKNSKSIWQSNSILDYIFNKIFFFYVLAIYLNLYSSCLENHWWFRLNCRLISFFNFLYYKFFFFFLLLWIVYFLLLCCIYFILGFSILHPFFF